MSQLTRALTALTKRGEVHVTNDEAPLVVRGLSTDDIMALVDRHRAIADKMFDDFAGEDGAKALSDPTGIATKVLKDAPELVADIIALALDEPENRDGAKRLPVGLQIKLIEKILEITTHVDGGLGELLEIVVRALVGGSEILKAATSLPR